MLERRDTVLRNGCLPSWRKDMLMSLGVVCDRALESEMDVVGHCRRECQGDAASTGPSL